MAEKKNVSRRDFLHASVATSALVLGSGCGSDDESSSANGSGGQAGGGGSGGADAGAPDAGEDVAIPAGKTAVSFVHRENVEDSVRRAIALAGGIDDIQEGQTVFIKPNAVHPAATAPAIVTSNEVLAAIVRIVREKNPGRIIVGDRSARTFETSAVFSATGMEQAAMDAGADEVFAAPKPADAPDEWVMVQPDRYDEWWSGVGGVLAMKKALEADHLINVPTCKNHRWAVHSLALKNFIGAVGDESRDEMHYQAGEPDDLSRAIAILNQIYSPLINIIDALGALINGGPEGVLPDAVRTEPGLIIASRDRIAAEVGGLALMKVELGRTDVPTPDVMHDRMKNDRPWDHAQVVHGIERGLGVAGPDDVLLRFDDVSDAAAIEQIFRS